MIEISLIKMTAGCYKMIRLENPSKVCSGFWLYIQEDITRAVNVGLFCCILTHKKKRNNNKHQPMLVHRRGSL